MKTYRLYRAFSRTQYQDYFTEVVGDFTTCIKALTYDCTCQHFDVQWDKAENAWFLGTSYYKPNTVRYWLADVEKETKYEAFKRTKAPVSWNP